MSGESEFTRHDVALAEFTVEMRSMNGKIDAILARYDDHEERLRSLERAEEIKKQIAALEERVRPLEQWQKAVPISVITALLMSFVTAGSTIFQALFT